MRIFGNLFLASAVLLNSIEFSIQVGPSGSSANPPPPKKASPMAPPKPPRQRKDKSTTNPGSSSANPAPAPGAPPDPTKKASSSKPKPEFGEWPRIMAPDPKLGLSATAPQIPTYRIRLDPTYMVFKYYNLKELGLLRLSPTDVENVHLEFHKYTFFPEQDITIQASTKKRSEYTDAAGLEHLVIVDARDMALAIVMPNSNILGMYGKGEERQVRKQVNIKSNKVDILTGKPELNHVIVGVTRVLFNRYKITRSRENSLETSYGRYSGIGPTPERIEAPKAPPRKRKRTNPKGSPK